MTDECFVIGPIGEPGGPTRRHADQLFKHVILPTLSQMGYEPSRADLLDEAGLITTQIIQHLVEAPLVIADLTDHNPNVFYELAIRHALRKPLIQMIRLDQVLPFDIAATRTIKFDLGDLDSVELAKEAIRRQAERLRANPADFDTPISAAINVRVLEASDHPEAKALTNILESIQDLRKAIERLDGNTADAKPAAKLSANFMPEYLDEIRARLPTSKVVGEKVKLKKQGREWAGLSPFNKEKTPSFFVNDAKGFYHCFSSGKHGDIFRFLMETEGISFAEAVHRLAVRAGMDSPIAN